MGGFNYMAPKGNLFIMLCTTDNKMRLTVSTKQAAKMDGEILLEKIEDILRDFEY